MLGSKNRLANISLATIVLVATLSIGIHGVTVNSPLKLHGQIHIDGNNGFTPANGVVSGIGTVSDPYVIEGWEFNLALDQQIIFPRGMLDVWNTTAHFIIQGIRADEGAGGYPPFWAIQLVNVTGAQVSSSLISSTYSGGILISKSSNVLVETNGFSVQDTPGVSTYSSTNITVRGNSFSGNGITLESSSRVIVYHNNFWRTLGKDDSPTENRWDGGYPIGGNYWSSYASGYVDKCSGPRQDICTSPDGIADKPQFVAENCPCPTAVDDYPLMSPYSPAPDIVPPTWGIGGASLSISELTMTSFTVSWSAASDDVGVVAYRIFWGGRCCSNGTLAAEVSPNVNRYSVSGLSPRTNYVVWIEAGDAAGNWDVGGYVGVTTPTWWQQYWYIIAAGVAATIAFLVIDERRKERGKEYSMIRQREIERLTQSSRGPTRR